jgi:hypothetical protein
MEISPMNRYTLLTLAMLCAAPAASANIVSNSGFERDHTSAGLVSPPAGWSASGDAGADSTLPFSGTNNAFLGIGGLSQDLSTAAGARYTISFYLAADQTTMSDASSTFGVTFGGTDLLSGTPIAGSDFSTPDQYVKFTY